MASKLLNPAPYEAENDLELSLRQSFHLLEPKLRPPLPLTIPTADDYSNLNRAILYGVLTEPSFAGTHIKHLHAIVTDGYALFASLLARVVTELYDKLSETAKVQVLWATREMVGVSALGFGGLLVSLLRQMVGGDFSDGNLWLCFEMASLFLSEWSCLLEEEPLVLTSALYSLLRLLSDHCRMMVSAGNSKLDALRRLEIEFCIKMLREQFRLCLKIGRDLIRLLQDLVCVPEFRAIWRDLVLNPSAFRVEEFSSITQIYGTRTSSQYFLLRITPEMETQLRFLLTHVKLGSQMRHQAWFASEFFCSPERETLIIDIVRFVCCAHHPTNEIIRSNIIPRWAVIGWLLKCCRKSYMEANVKLALFYDWLFFDERIDKVMNIEPVMLLMVYSIPKYIDITQSLLEFLFFLVDNYDVDHKGIICRGVSASFRLLISKGVIRKLGILTSAESLSPFLKERLRSFILGTEIGITEGQTAKTLGRLVPLEVETAIHKEQLIHAQKDESKPKTPDRSTSFPYSASVMDPELQEKDIERLLQVFGHAIRNSKALCLQTLREILDLFLDVDSGLPAHCSITPEVLSSKIEKELEFNGCKLFAPPEHPREDPQINVVESVTILIIRRYLFSRSGSILQMLLFWSRDGVPVGAFLLHYAARLAYEANLVDDSVQELPGDKLPKLINTQMSFLKHHVDEYLLFLHNRSKSSPEALVSESGTDRELVVQLIDDAFWGYRHYLMNLGTILQEKFDRTLPELLVFDIAACSEWKGVKLSFLFHSVFSQLSDLSVGKECVIQLLVNQLNDNDLVNVQFDIVLKKLSVVGGNVETISNIIKTSLCWGCLEQHKLWTLIRLDLVVYQVPLEELILKFFCSSEINADICSIAVGALLDLCSSHAPTPELVGAILMLPNNVFQNFAATVLALWAMSSASVLFDSLAEFSKKLEIGDGKSIFSKSGECAINHSAISWLLNYFGAQGLSLSNVLGRFAQTS